MGRTAAAPEEARPAQGPPPRLSQLLALRTLGPLRSRPVVLALVLRASRRLSASLRAVTDRRRRRLLTAWGALQDF